MHKHIINLNLFNAFAHFSSPRLRKAERAGGESDYLVLPLPPLPTHSGGRPRPVIYF